MDVAFLNMDNINLKVNTQGVFFFVPPKDMIFFVAYIYNNDNFKQYCEL